ncbi:LysR family transcriptional regulator [Streptomyces iranensis]|uniref:DNA-binding transcriptional LysR family regulator n=1 Tax=Streptomyces iranensis TaxID=576784 RepID=A0A060ZMN4_9ACTN|nr:LysR substrate-binding domain-containing protein [Streptomyces iranensis]MBP2062342.1 DNA-binding transcriptional LysR family regulator [Streptomyces iranensis]CDR07457.1 LysR family transcriptional regulator [Streptomyces iranensis]
MTMELRHVRYFVAVAEELNFGRAAARLNIAQPPLSVQIRDLERELGVKLFERTGKGVTLTQEGAVFLLEARQICDQVSRARHAVNQATAGELGHLRVAGIPFAFMEVLPLVIPRFREENPHVLIDLREAGTQESFDSLRTGAMDIAFVRQSDPVAGLEVLPLLTGRFELIVPRGHRLARDRPADIAELAFEPLVMTSRQISPYYYDRTLSAMSAAGITPHAVVEATSIQAQLGYVASGMGVSLVPASARWMSSKYIEWVPLKQAIVATEVAAVWASGPVPQVLDNFLKVVREESAGDHGCVRPGR